MGKTVTSDMYKELLKFKSYKSFPEILAGMLKKKGNLEILEIGFGSRNSGEKEMQKAELKKVEGDFQKWLDVEVI